MALNQFDDLFRGVEVGGVMAQKMNQTEELSKAAGLTEHLPQTDLVAVVGQVGNVLSYVVVESERALLSGEHHVGCGELLRAAPYVEDRLGRESTKPFPTEYDVLILDGCGNTSLKISLRYSL